MSVLGNEDSRAEAPELPSWRRWACLAVLSVSLLAVVMDMSVLNVALPDLAADLSPSATQQLWIVDVYSLVLAGLLVSMSALADRWGRKRLLLAGFGVFGAASLVVLAATTAEGVIAVRALLGVGGALIMPTTLSMVRTVFTDPAERATALGVWAAVSSLGIAVGPIVGGLLLEHFSWQAAFLVNVPLMAAGIAAGVWLLPESRASKPGRWDPLATALSIAGMASLVWAIKDLGERYADDGLANPVAWTVLAAALVALTWFVLRCLRRPDPLLDVRLFVHRAFTAGTLTALASMFAMAALLLLVAQWLQLVEGHSPLKAGVYLLPMAVGALLASPAAPMLAARIGVRVVLGGGLAIAGAGFLLLCLAPAPLSYPWVAASLALQGAGAGALAVASAVIMSGSPPDKAGSAAAIEETSYELGSVLGIAILGSVAAVVYRAHLTLDDLAAQAVRDGLPAPAVDEAADSARQSLGGAMEAASRAGLPDLAARAQEAFTDSLVRTGLLGGVSLLAFAAVVFALTPRDADPMHQQH
ncbi:MFS transporter [Actinocorallia aurantiaca]|uniref:Quaternary ammonium compound efflux MFS transporter QacA n=1 Tax=Actinocorallia aurantiaca TaxID=46204 RepID=A0ABP6GMF4_9ACTN